MKKETWYIRMLEQKVRLFEISASQNISINSTAENSILIPKLEDIIHFVAMPLVYPLSLFAFVWLQVTRGNTKQQILHRKCHGSGPSFALRPAWHKSINDNGTGKPNQKTQEKGNLTMPTSTGNTKSHSDTTIKSFSIDATVGQLRDQYKPCESTKVFLSWR